MNPLLNLSKPAPEFQPAGPILDYLENELPGYRFDPDIDEVFVDELVADFPQVNVLEVIKTFRWYYDNEPLSGIIHQRAAIRRWVAREAPRCRASLPPC